MENLYAVILEWTRIGKPCVMATIIKAKGSVPRKAGAKMVISSDGATAGTVGGGALELAVMEAARETFATGQPKLLTYQLQPDLNMICGGSAEVFIEPLLPCPRLYIFGGGHIGSVLCTMASRVGFSVTIIDERPDYADANRHPAAVDFIASYNDKDWEKLIFDENTYCVIVTPSHSTDHLVVRSLLDHKVAYLGMIGSKRKRKILDSKLLEEGFSASHLERLHSPVGLAIGADTPEEIAVSILAELIKIRRTSPQQATSCG